MIASYTTLESAKEQEYESMIDWECIYDPSNKWSDWHTLQAFHNIIQFSCSQPTNQIAVFSWLNWIILWNAHNDNRKCHRGQIWCEQETKKAKKHGLSNQSEARVIPLPPSLWESDNESTLKMCIHTWTYKRLLLFLLAHYPIPPAVPLPLCTMARTKKSHRPYQPRVIDTLLTPLAPRMAAKGHVPRCIDHSHELSDKSENGSNSSDNRSNTLSGGSVNSKESGSVSNNGSSDSESSVGNSENPSSIMDRHQATGWVFNKGLNLILHEVDNCHMCNKFAVHYSSVKACLHSSHNMACSAWQHLIAKDVEEWIDGHQSQLKKLSKSIPHLQEVLERICEETKTACSKLEDCCMRLGKVHCQLEEDRWDQGAANGSCTSISSKSSKCPWPSQSPSLRPPKLLCHASISSMISNFTSGSKWHSSYLLFTLCYHTRTHHKCELHDGHGACITPSCMFQLSCSFPQAIALLSFLTWSHILLYSAMDTWLLIQ